MNQDARFVLDTSTTMAWCFEDEADPYADAVLDTLKENTAITPGLWMFEVANVLLVGKRRGRINREEVEELVMLLAELPVHVREAGAIHRALELVHLGRERHLTAYDAAFLVLAKQTGLPIATLDNKLARAAGEMGVSIFDPHQP